jgi:RNA-binding motif X-linked protein 2
MWLLLRPADPPAFRAQYKDSAYINVGGLPYNLTEGDVITIFSQYGEIVDINMPRDPQTGKPRGFAWLMYADQRSTVLAVDNLNGAQVLGRTLRVDHVLNYKQLERDQETGKMKERDEQRCVLSLSLRNSLDAED